MWCVFMVGVGGRGTDGVYGVYMCGWCVCGAGVGGCVVYVCVCLGGVWV